MFRTDGPTLPPNEPTWKSSGPCPSCAAKDARIAELEEELKKWNAGWEITEEDVRRVTETGKRTADEMHRAYQVELAAHSSTTRNLREAESRAEAAEKERDEVMRSARQWEVVARARLDEQADLVTRIEQLDTEIRPLRVIKSINDFTEAEEKELDELRVSAASLSRDLADARGQVCRAKEAIISVCNKLTTSWDLTEYGKALVRELDAALSSSPCAHAEEAKGLEAELDATIVTGRKREERIAALEKVVEAARKYTAHGYFMGGPTVQDDYEALCAALRTTEGK